MAQGRAYQRHPPVSPVSTRAHPCVARQIRADATSSKFSAPPRPPLDALPAFRTGLAPACAPPSARAPPRPTRARRPGGPQISKPETLQAEGRAGLSGGNSSRVPGRVHPRGARPAAPRRGLTQPAAPRSAASPRARRPADRAAAAWHRLPGSRPSAACLPAGCSASLCRAPCGAPTARTSCRATPLPRPRHAERSSLSAREPAAGAKAPRGQWRQPSRAQKCSPKNSRGKHGGRRVWNTRLQAGRPEAAQAQEPPSSNAPTRCLATGHRDAHISATRQCRP